MKKTFWFALILSFVIQVVPSPPAAISAAPLGKLQISSVSDTPDPFSPNGDGRLDVVKITSALNIEGTGQTANAVLKGDLTVKDSSGNPVAHLEVGEQLDLDIGKWNETAFSAVWDGKTGSGEVAADGTYFYTVDLSLLKGCKGNGDNRDDLRSGQVDLLGDCNSGAGNDTKGERIIITAGPLSGEIAVDNTPPSIVLEGIADGAFTNKDVTPIISISDPYLASQSIFLNDRPFVSGTTLTEEGRYTLSIIAEDSAANSARADIEFTIDKTPPMASIISPADGLQTDESNPEILIEYSDGMSGVDVSTVSLTVDNVDVTSDVSVTEGGIIYIPFVSLQEGVHTIAVSASDMAGNTREVSATFTIRSRCPSIEPDPYGTDASSSPFIFPEPGFDSKSYREQYYYGRISNMEIADVNRDGYLDIVGADSVSGSWGSYKSKIAVLLGRGDGGFEKYADFAERHGNTYFSNQNSYAVSDIAIGDFNNDCYPDMAVTRKSPDEMYIFLNNGDGSFAEKAVYGIEGRCALLAGRFDGDGYEDIAVYNPEGKVTIFRGNGDGTFAAPVNLAIDSGYSGIVDMKVLDLNEDGITDMVAVMGNSSSNSQGREIILITGSFQGNFLQSYVYTATDNGTIGDVVIGDFNGDGHEDIVAERRPYYYDISGNPDIVLTTFLGDGSGSFSSETDSELWAEKPFAYYEKAMSLNVDGDKYGDIVMNADGNVYIYISNGDGTFQYYESYNIMNNNSIQIGDFDGDGDEDIVTSGEDEYGYVFVLSNSGDRTFIDRKNIPIKTAGQLVSADFDGDKRPDFAITAGYTMRSRALFSTILNKGDDWSEEPFQNSLSSSYNIEGGPAYVKIGNLDGDGHPDVVTANKAAGKVAVLINGGDGSLKAPVYYQVGQLPDNLVLTDLNGDNHLDIITANVGSGNVSVLLGRGDGAFQGQRTFAAGSVPKGLAVGDFNRDGKTDLAVTDSTWASNAVSVLFGNGDGTFRERTVITVNGLRLSTLKEGDYNNDGISDLAVFNLKPHGGWDTSTTIDLLLGKGDGTFLVKSTVLGGGRIDDFISSDFNRDGILDIVTFDSNSGRNIVFTGDGNGNFTQKQTFGQSVNWPAVSGDIDNDGETDLLIRDVGSLTPWFGQGDGTFKRGSSVGGTSAYALDLGDINGDGFVDIAVIDDWVRLSIILGTGGGSFQGESVVNETELYQGINLATGDYNGDSNQDIAVSMYPSGWYSPPTDKTKVMLYWGSGFNTFTPGPVIETDYIDHVLVFADDFNGDSKTDIALDGNYSDGTGDVSVFLSNGDGSFKGSLKYDLESNISAIKDVNGDDYPDIINNVHEYMGGTSSYGVSIHAGNGDGTFRHLQTVSLGERPSGWGFSSNLGDFNNDGQQDIAVLFHHYWYDQGELKIYLNRGDMFDTSPVYEMGTMGGYGMFSGDFNNDGYFDLGARSSYPDLLSLFSGNGDGTFRSAVLYASPGGSNIVFRDFNLDGRLDIAKSFGHNALGYVGLLYNALPPLRTPPPPPTYLKGIAGDATVALSWAENGEEGIEGYNVYRSLSAGGGYEKINDAPLVIPSYADYTVTNGTAYYYTVAAVDVDGEESSYAVKVRATPQPPDTTPPVVSILSPANNQTVTNPALFVSGTINEADARVTVNGVPGTVQKNSGTFTAYSVPLNIGENTITVAAEDSAGNTSFSQIKVTYAPVATIEGVAKDEDTGIPVAEAWVYVRDDKKEQAFSMRPDGSFTFLNVTPGAATITVDAYNYERVVIDTNVSSGENLVLDIPLPLYPATIRGSVYESGTYAGVGDATVTITDTKKTQTLSANDYGYFEASNVAPYQVTITVSGAGYETHTETRSITNRWTNYLYFYLDPLPPSPPSGLMATSGRGYVNLSWSANSETNIENYKIYRSATPGSGYQLIASTYSDEISYTDGNVDPGATYYYVIEAVNTSSQMSGYSAEVSATPEALPVPTGLTAMSGKGLVNLSWDAAAESMISSYKIYRSAESGGGYALIGSVDAPTNSYTDQNVDAGTTYYYVITAINTWSKEGAWSNEASATPEAVSLAVSITAPDDRTYHPTETAIVKGTIESLSPEVGVVLVVESDGKEGILSAGYFAEVNGRSFAAQISLLPRAMNTIKAIATLPTGEQAEAAITVYTGMDTEMIKLTPLPSSGIISAQTRTFDVTFEAEVNVAGTVTGYSWDFDGDGRVDQVTSIPSVTFGYTRSGIYCPTVTAADDQRNVYMATAVVNVMSVEEVDAILKVKWEGMKEALAKGDIEKAVADFAEGSQDSFRQQFTHLSKVLPRIVSEMGEATLVEVRGDRAIYDLRTVRNGSVYSFQLEFVREGDGIWRIRSF